MGNSASGVILVTMFTVRQAYPLEYMFSSLRTGSTGEDFKTQILIQ